MDKYCYNCKYFEEAFGYLEEGCKCRKTGKYTKSDNTCPNHENSSQQYFDYDYDEYGY